MKKYCIIGMLFLSIGAGAFWGLVKINDYKEEKKIVQNFEEKNENRTFVEYIKGTSNSVVDYAILFDDTEKGSGVEIKTESGIGTLFLGTDMPEQKKIKDDERMVLNKEKNGVCFTMWEMLTDEMIDYEILVTDVDGNVNFKVKSKKRE